jgi:hypothetical protein
MSIDNEFKVPVAEAENIPVTTEQETPINTEELSKKFLADEEKFNKLNTEGKQEDTKAYQETLASIKVETPEKKDEKSAEARKEHRKEFILKALQIMIDNLQQQNDSNSLKTKFIKLWGKDELDKEISGLMVYQSQVIDGRRDRLNWDLVFNETAGYVDTKVKKELKAMAKSEFDEEDLQTFYGDESVRNQVGHTLSDVTKG